MSDPPVPPLALDYGTAIHHFREVGEEYFHYAVRPDLGALRPDGAVLDVGCGFGRLAVPLTGYLGGDVRYEGFDIVPAGVDWCREHVTTRFPNFRFSLVNVENFTYRAGEGVPATEFRFPYGDGLFDLVFLRSVFTHMLPEEVDHYLGEIARVMKPRGRCLISYFLITSESERLMEGPRARRWFSDRDGVTMRDEANGMWTVAYNLGHILYLYESHGLELVGPVHFGSWCGRTEFLTFQDLIVAAKKEG